PAHVVAYQLATPGFTSSGLLRNGIASWYATARDRRRGEREAEPREEIATAVVPFGGPIPEFQIVRHVSNGTCRNRDTLPARSGRRLASGDSRCTIPSSAATAVRPASSARRGRDTTGSRWRPTGADCG